MPYSFAKESDIRRIIRSVLATERDLLSRPTRTGSVQMPGAVQVYAARVNDAGGIAAGAGTTPGSGTVDVYEIDSGTLTAVAAMAGITAYNSSSSAIADDAWIVITRDPYTGSWSIVQLQGDNVTQTLFAYVSGDAIAKRVGTQMYSSEVQVWEGNGSGEISDSGDTVTAWNPDSYQAVDSSEYCLLHWEPYGSIWLAEGWEPSGSAGTETVTAVVDVSYASGVLKQTKQVFDVSNTQATATSSVFTAATVTSVVDVDYVDNALRKTHQPLTVLGESGATTANVFTAATAAVVVDVDYTDSAARFWQTKATMTLLVAGSNVTSTWEEGTSC